MPEEPVIESQAGGDDDNLDPETTSGAPAGDPGSSVASGSGRTLEQLRGELLRKYGGLSEQVKELTEGIKAISEHLGAAKEPAAEAGRNISPYNVPMSSGPAPMVSPYGAPSPLAQYTDAQLNGALVAGGLTPFQQQAIDSELRNRQDARRIDQLFAERQKKEKFETLQRQSEDAALKAFPALRDESSEFSRRVAAELDARRSMFGVIPTDKFDVANGVARSMGVEVSRVFVPGYVAPAAGSDDGVRGRDQGEYAPQGLSEPEAAALAEKFKYALPTDAAGVRRKFDMKKVLKSSQEYGEARERMVGGGRRAKGTKQ